MTPRALRQLFLIFRQQPRAGRRGRRPSGTRTRSACRRVRLSSGSLDPSYRYCFASSKLNESAFEYIKESITEEHHHHCQFSRMKKYQNLSNEETCVQFVVEHNQGIGIKKLCRKYGIGSATAYRWLDDGTPRQVNAFPSITPRQIYQLRTESERLKQMVQIFEDCNMSEMLSPKAKCELVDKLSGKYSIHILCRTLKLRRSTYYHHLKSPEKTLLEKQDDELRPLVKGIFEESHEHFGAHKIKVVLAQRGIVACEKRIARLMKQMNLVCKQCRLKVWSSANRQYKYYPDRLKKKFTQTAPNQVWVSDVTYVRVNEAFYYVCAILDLFSRRIVGWKISNQNSSDMLMEAFDNAYKQRGKPKTLMLHSDQGANYTSYMFRSYLRELKVTQSFSHPGTPHDNAVNESFFACMKREELSHKFYRSVEELIKDVGEYAVFYNGMRPHERLGDKTPMQIETEYWQQQETQKGKGIMEQTTITEQHSVLRQE